MPVLPVGSPGGLVVGDVSTAPVSSAESVVLDTGDWIEFFGAYGHAKYPGRAKDPVWQAFWDADDAWLAKGGYVPPPLSDKARKLPLSAGFQQLFPNFSVLSKPAQESALRTVQRIQDAFPDFIETLNRVKDPAFGPGYQIYFVPEEPVKDGPMAFLQQNGDLKNGGKHAGIVYNQNQAFFMARMAAPIIRIVHSHNIGGVKQTSAEELTSMHYSDVLAHELAHLLHDHYLSKGDQTTLGGLFDLAVKRHGPFDKKPYWSTNPREYFAESVMAFLTDYDRPTPPSLTGKTPFFTRSQLERFHPEMASFVARLFDGTHQKPFRSDGGMVSLRVARLGGQTVGGAGVAAEKDLLKSDYGRLSMVGTAEAMGNRQSLILRGSAGLRTTLGPDPKDGLPIGIYGEGGVSGTIGYVGKQDATGLGPYAAAGVIAKGANVEFRRDWTPAGPADTVSLGYAVRF